jgi:cytochrome c oxidase subunit 4
MTDTPAARRPRYMRIFVFLALLTAVEVAVALTPVPKSAQVLFLIALAIAKATLVALYYMHLRFEGRILRIIATAPLLFAIILAIPPFIDLALRR